jgi:hypothetical protein
MSDYYDYFDITKKHYILYSEDFNHNRFYIANTNPIIWSSIQFEAKAYLSSKNAEFDIVGNYQNYQVLRQMLNTGTIANVYVAEVDKGEETRRLKIL